MPIQIPTRCACMLWHLCCELHADICRGPYTCVSPMFEVTCGCKRTRIQIVMMRHKSTWCMSFHEDQRDKRMRDEAEETEEPVPEPFEADFSVDDDDIVEDHDDGREAVIM